MFRDEIHIELACSRLGTGYLSAVCLAFQLALLALPLPGWAHLGAIGFGLLCTAREIRHVLKPAVHAIRGAPGAWSICWRMQGEWQQTDALYLRHYTPLCMILTFRCDVREVQYNIVVWRDAVPACQWHRLHSLLLL